MIRWLITSISDGIYNRQLIKDGKRDPNVKAPGNREPTEQEMRDFYSNNTPSDDKRIKWHRLDGEK